jgi:hypothetical protein
MGSWRGALECWLGTVQLAYSVRSRPRSLFGCEDLGKFTDPHAPLTYTSEHCQDIFQSSLPYNLHSQLHSPFSIALSILNCTLHSQLHSPFSIALSLLLRQTQKPSTVKTPSVQQHINLTQHSNNTKMKFILFLSTLTVVLAAPGVVSTFLPFLYPHYRSSR